LSAIAQAGFGFVTQFVSFLALGFVPVFL